MQNVLEMVVYWRKCPCIDIDNVDVISLTHGQIHVITSGHLLFEKILTHALVSQTKSSEMFKLHEGK